MRTEDSSIALTPIEVELLLAALTHYEFKFRRDRSEKLTESIQVLRAKLLDIP